jgi:hypothetical protein
MRRSLIRKNSRRDSDFASENSDDVNIPRRLHMTIVIEVSRNWVARLEFSAFSVEPCNSDHLILEKTT